MPNHILPDFDRVTRQNPMNSSTTRRTVTYDDQSYQLAGHFLQDEPYYLNNDDCRDELAREIQKTIEAWIEEKHRQQAHKDFGS